MPSHVARPDGLIVTVDYHTELNTSRGSQSSEERSMVGPGPDLRLVIFQLPTDRTITTGPVTQTPQNPHMGNTGPDRVEDMAAARVAQWRLRLTAVYPVSASAPGSPDLNYRFPAGWTAATAAPVGLVRGRVGTVSESCPDYCGSLRSERGSHPEIVQLAAVTAELIWPVSRSNRCPNNIITYYYASQTTKR